MTDEQFAQAIAYRERFKKHLTGLPGDDGVLVQASVPDIAPLTTDGDDKMESLRNCSLQMLSRSGLSGFAQLSMPLGNHCTAGLVAAGASGQ